MKRSVMRRKGHAYALAIMCVWLGGSSGVFADDCAALQARLRDQAEMLRGAKLAVVMKRSQLEVRQSELARAQAALREADKQIDTMEADYMKAPAGMDITELALRWAKASDDRDSLRKQVIELNDAVDGPRRVAEELEIANALSQIEAAEARQALQRQNAGDCDRKLPAPVQRADPPSQVSSPSGQAAAPPADLPPLPSPPDGVAQPASQPGQTATTTSGLPPLPPPAAGPGNDAVAAGMTSAIGDNLPPLPPMDDFLVPPRPSTLTQPTIAEPPPPPVAGLPRLPPLPPIASASPSTEIIRAPVIRAPNVSAPPIVIPNVSAPPVHVPVVRAPPVNIPQVHAPPVYAPVVRAPPIHAPNIRAPNIRGPRVPVGERDKRWREAPLTPDRRRGTTRIVRHPPAAATIRTRQVAPRATPRVVYTQPRRPDFSGLAARARAIGSIGRLPAPTGRRWGR